MFRFLILPFLALALYATIASAAVPSGQPAKDSDESIGSATMKPDGTLVLNLRGEGDDTGNSQIIYTRDNKEYLPVLHHIGKISPGETRPVMPWPEND